MTVVASDLHLGVIRTQIPARLDRLPWSSFHWRVVAGLGTVWILDGLEVTIVGAIGARLTEAGSGITMTAADIGLAAAIYITGACLGALFFGQLTDRFGRKNLMMITLAVYITATVATSFATAPWYFFLCRFVTGAGIGGEYAAINSAIDELIPARNRGQVDITINGSYWVGSAVGGLAALVLLNESMFPKDLGWRLAFAVGAFLGLLILLVRRSVPESPRWLFIHGREQEAERIVDRIERDIASETGQPLPQPRGSITVRQRLSIPFREIAKVAIRFYPKRATLGLALFVGQAFLYNAVTFDIGTLLTTFYNVSSSAVPYFVVVFAVGNFAGPFLLGRLFDTVGRKPMISGTYFISALLTGVLALFLLGGALNEWSFILLVSLTFFFASAGASSAYLTVSEIFPMETRALAIAFFYALGTAVGGITGPLLFGNMIATGDSSIIAIGFFIGAVVMALGGFAELFLGVRAEGVALENIAKPLTVASAEQTASTTAESPQGATATAERTVRREQVLALQMRERAEEERARAAEHRAVEHHLLANGEQQDGRAATEAVLASIAELHAARFDELAASHDELDAAEAAAGNDDRTAARRRAAAAQQRARAAQEQAEALAASDSSGRQAHQALDEAALERARSQVQLTLARVLPAPNGPSAQGQQAAYEKAVHEAWALAHDLRARALTAQVGDHGDGERAGQEAAAAEQRAREAEARLEQVRHRAAANELLQQEGTAEQVDLWRRESAERERQAREREERIRQRLDRSTSRARHGLRRFRPGPAEHFFSPGMVGTASRWDHRAADQDLDREIESIGRALAERGALSRSDLARTVGARYWGPGRFRAALRAAVDEGYARRMPEGTFEPVSNRS